MLGTAVEVGAGSEIVRTSGFPSTDGGTGLSRRGSADTVDADAGLLGGGGLESESGSTSSAAAGGRPAEHVDGRLGAAAPPVRVPET